MHLFHKWSKWEQYTWVGSVTRVSLFVKQTQRLPIPLTEERQRRKCEICGKMQDEEI